jgi:hypothetical protein
MSETASGFVRIATLVMMAAVFGIVWRGDQQTQQQFIIARKAAAQRETILAERSAHREAAEQLHASAPKSTLALTSATETIAPPKTLRIARVEIEMELPAEIAPGTYQIVDQSGQMQKVRIPEAEHAVCERDLYVLDQEDGGRRYFIRISENTETPHIRTASGRAASRR